MRDYLKEYRCPECAQPMERGYVRAGHSIRWESWDDDASPRLFAFVRSEKLTSDEILGGSDVKCLGLRCRTCGLVLFKQAQR
jgi:hypothetical protein